MAISTIGQEGLSSSAQYIGFKNRIINGDMRIDQRNAGAAATWNGASIFGVDRFRSSSAGQTWGTGVITAQQSTTAPAGFYNSQKLTVATADVSLAANDGYAIVQSIEANNIVDLNLGSANASSFTVSFWVQSSITGTYAGSLISLGVLHYSYVFTYSIASANTWTYVSVTVPGQTTNNTPVTGANTGLQILFDLGSGIYAQTATTNAWQSGVYTRTSGSVNWISNAGATFYITGVQLEKGSVATAFDYRPYGTELQLCQRYYEILYSSYCFETRIVNPSYLSKATACWQYMVPKRAAPTLSTFPGSTIVLDRYGIGSASYTNIGFGNNSTSNVTIDVTLSSNYTTGERFTFVGGNVIQAVAEI